MGWIDNIYGASPVFVQNLMVSAYGLNWHNRRFGGIYKEEYSRFKKREGFTKAQWDDYTAEHLIKMLLHAFEHVPYYKQLWSEKGITTVQLKGVTPDTLNKLPFLEKDDLRRYGKTSLLASNLEKGGSFFSSSGTTGTPTSILFSHKMHQRWTAGFEARIRNWAGLTHSNARGMIGGRRIVKQADAPPPYYRYNIFEKQTYFSAYHISAKNSPDYLQGIRKHRPEYMTGYAMSNYLLATHFKEQQMQVPEMKAVITSSEKLTAHMRNTLSDVYNCKVYDSYSGVEACSLISECEHGNLHVSPDVGLIEFLNKDGIPALPGEQAEMVCTGFLNFDQPLIRYRIGDTAILQEGKCACGRETPLVKEISGREEDIITSKDGRQMVRFHGVFIDIPHIKAGQVVQTHLDEFTVKVLAEHTLSDEDLNNITKKMTSQLGNDIKIDIRQVENIPLSPNGKFKAVISRLK